MFSIKKVFIIEEGKNIEDQCCHSMSSFGIDPKAVSVREKIIETQGIIAPEN